MKKLIIAGILFTLASCATQPEQDYSQWGKWGNPNYISNKYAQPQAIKTTGTTPMTIAPGWAVSR